MLLCDASRSPTLTPSVHSFTLTLPNPAVLVSLLSVPYSLSLSAWNYSLVYFPSVVSQAAMDGQGGPESMEKAFDAMQACIDRTGALLAEAATNANKTRK